MSSSIRRAVLYSSVTRYSMRFMGLFSTMIIARLLTPEEIGTFAIASAIVMVMSEFRLLGAGAYLVREQELTEEKIRSATGLTVLISWGLGLLRSEEHTSELQSRPHLVCRLLLEKKK